VAALQQQQVAIRAARGLEAMAALAVEQPDLLDLEEQQYRVKEMLGDL